MESCDTCDNANEMRQGDTPYGAARDPKTVPLFFMAEAPEFRAVFENVVLVKYCLNTKTKQ